MTSRNGESASSDKLPLWKEMGLTVALWLLFLGFWWGADFVMRTQFHERIWMVGTSTMCLMVASLLVEKKSKRGPGRDE